MYCQKCDSYIPDGLGLSACPACSIDLNAFPPKARVRAVQAPAAPAAKAGPVKKAGKKPSLLLFLIGGVLLGIPGAVVLVKLRPAEEVKAPAADPAATATAAVTAPAAAAQFTSVPTPRSSGEIPWDRFELKPDLEGAKHDIRVILQWLIDSDFPGSETILKNYLAAVDVMGEMPSPFIFTKTHSAIGVNVYVDPQALSKFLGEAVEKRSPDYFCYMIASLVVQEAWGYEYFHTPKAARELEELQKIHDRKSDDPQVYVNAVRFLMAPWGNQQLVKSFFERDGDDIVKRAAMTFSMEAFELTEKKEFEAWAVRKGLISEGRLKPIVGPAINQWLQGRLLIADMNDNERIWFGLSQLIPINVTALQGGQINDESFTYGLYGIYEIWRFVVSGGSEGVDPNAIAAAQTKGLPPPSAFKTISPQFLKYVKEP